MKFKIIIFIFLICATGKIFPQYETGNLSFGFNASYITTARMFLNPESENFDLRNRGIDVEDIYGYSADLRYAISSRIILGLNVDLIEKTLNLPNLLANTSEGLRSIGVDDGFRLIPVELTVYYFLPFSTDKFKFMMGGGAGYYYGKFIRKLNEDLIESENKEFSYGIHVAVSMDYLISKMIAIRTEMKFRDPQYTTTNTYKSREVENEGRPVLLLNDSFRTKINVDGVSFSIGAVIHFDL